MKKRRFRLLKQLEKLALIIPVSDIMIRDIKTINEESNANEALGIMAKQSISGLIVTNKEGMPTGIVSESDLLRKVFEPGKNPNKVKVREIMSGNLFTARPEQSIGEVASIMRKHGVSRLPVVENDALIGYVTKTDLLEKMNFMYYQNTRLRWLPALMMLLVIAIAILMVLYVNKP